MTEIVVRKTGNTSIGSKKAQAGASSRIAPIVAGLTAFYGNNAGFR